MWPLVAAAGVGLANAGRSWWLGQQRADLQRQETTENVRRFKLNADRTISATRAAGAASGVEFESGSLQRYLADMSSEFDRQIGWMQKAGYGSADVTSQAANFGLVTDLGSTFFNLGQSNNWWQQSRGT